MFFRETEKQYSLRRPKKHSVQDHACVDAPRLNAQAPSREIIVNMVKSANATVKDIAGRHAQLLQLQCVAQGQVDVWFGPRGGVGNLPHRKACMAEFVVDLLPHFEVLQRDAWANDGSQLVIAAVEKGMQLQRGLTRNALHGATPSCMHNGGTMVDCIVENDGNAIGRGNAYAHMALTGDKRIDALQLLLLCG